MSHFNYVRCGVEILSRSKRIINKVFDCANYCNVKLYYQDTYSTHLKYDDAFTIVKRCKQNYNQDLVADGLDNFHVDFSMDGAATETYGVDSLLLVKKHISIC